jgi:hypothetical protein
VLLAGLGVVGVLALALERTLTPRENGITVDDVEPVPTPTG